MGTETRKLKLPSGMSETSLRLENSRGNAGIGGVGIIRTSVSSPRAISSLSSSAALPSKSSTLSDRFIPCRSSSRLHTFGLVEKMNSCSSPYKEAESGGGSNEVYSRLLKAKLFGAEFGCFSPDGNGGANGACLESTNRNMLRFKD